MNSCAKARHIVAVTGTLFALLGCESARQTRVDSDWSARPGRGSSEMTRTGYGSAATTNEPSARTETPSAREKAHHAHVLLLHGLGMVAEGADLVMTSGLSFTEGAAEKTRNHGREMMQDGKDMITRASGMIESSSPLYEYTQELKRVSLQVVNALEGMPAMDSGDAQNLGLHDMHLLLDHAIGMASEGANFVMLGNIDMSGSVGQFAAEHGRMMLEASRQITSNVLEGEAMQSAHQAGFTPETSDLMRITHELGKQVQSLIVVLGDMPLSSSRSGT